MYFVGLAHIFFILHKEFLIVLRFSSIEVCWFVSQYFKILKKLYCHKIDQTKKKIFVTNGSHIFLLIFGILSLFFTKCDNYSWTFAFFVFYL